MGSFFRKTRPGVDADDIAGNLVVGDNHGTIIQNYGSHPSSEPFLNWREIPQEPDIFRLLSWRTRITPLVGRNAQELQLLEWARKEGGVRVRFLAGPGGSGKSRLAAEVAEALRAEGWPAGFARLDEPALLPVRSKGLFLAVDYPEERREATKELLTALAGIEEDCRVRVLFVSRRSIDEWGELIDEAHAAEICDGQSSWIEALSESNAVEVFHGATRNLAQAWDQEAPPVGRERIVEWLRRDPSINHLPLFVTAAAVHAMLEPGKRLDLSGGGVIQALVRREVQRMSGAGRGLDFEAEAIPRLAALAAVRGGLPAPVIARLAREAPEIGLNEPERVVDRVRKLDFFDGEILRAPSPDVVAAALAQVVLSKREDRVSEWLWLILQDAPPEWIAQAERSCYDIGMIFEPSMVHLPKWLAGMVSGKVDRAHALNRALSGSPLSCVRPLAMSVYKILAEPGHLEKGRRASVLNNLSNLLKEKQDRAAALDAINSAVGLFRELARTNRHFYGPRLASSLANRSNLLVEANQLDQALESIQEAVEIWRELLPSTGGQHRPNLAAALVNMSSILSDMGSPEEALRVIDSAICIWSELATIEPARFDIMVATSLGNRSNLLAVAGHREKAIDDAEQAVVICRRYAQGEPFRFERYLAESLCILANRRLEERDFTKAADAVREALQIARRLESVNPDRINPLLEHLRENLAKLEAKSHPDGPQQGR